MGERRLGELDGVLASRIGMLDGREVVEIDFDPTVLSFAKLLGEATKVQRMQGVYARNKKQAQIARKRRGMMVKETRAKVNTGTQQQYDLAHDKAHYLLPLTALQATRLNALIAKKQSPDGLLSPSQLALRKRLRKALAQKSARLSKLKPDRSSKGLPKYAATLEKALQGI